MGLRTAQKPPERRSNGIPNHIRGHHEGSRSVDEDACTHRQE